MKYWIYYQIASIRVKYVILCGRIGEWFLWQEWKEFVDREEFEIAIRRLRGIK